MTLRSPIVTILAHVDHGKTTLLDRIRESAVTEKEAGGITQLISTTKVPSRVIRNLCSDLVDRLNVNTKIPGLLFVDTPGHASFTTMRQRGGSIADIAILVVDINEGIMPQTEESIEILKRTKTPFVVVLNKIDKIRGWKSPDKCFLDNLQEQNEKVKGEFEKKFYSVIQQLQMKGVNAERYDRIDDFTKKVAAVPASALTGEGVPDILVMLMGLAQQYLKDKLEVEKKGKAAVLEVKETKGLGTTVDVVLYDGEIKKDDFIVIGGKRPKITKVKALLEPREMQDIRREKQFKQVEKSTAACGIRIAAPDLDDVIAGSTLEVAQDQEKANEILERMKEEKDKAEIHRDKEGLVLRGDTLGSLEALENLFEEYDIRSASVETIKKDAILDAKANNDPLKRVVIGFNVKPNQESRDFAKDKNVKLLVNNVIYRLKEDYEEWEKEEKEKRKREVIKGLTRPGKFRLLPDFVFRANNPAVVGCEILEGKVTPDVSVMNKKGEVVGSIKEIQKENENVSEAMNGDRVAVSIMGPTVGRQIEEGQILYTNVESHEYKKLNDNKQFLTKTEINALKEISEIKSKKDKRYGF